MLFVSCLYPYCLYSFIAKNIVNLKQMHDLTSSKGHKNNCGWPTIFHKMCLERGTSKTGQDISFCVFLRCQCQTVIYEGKFRRWAVSLPKFESLSMFLNFPS